jgi:hypothetical protein
MFKKGNRIFSTATLFLFIIAFLHTLDLSNLPVDPEGKALTEQMKNYTMDMGIMETNAFNIQMSLGLTMTLFLIMLGVINVIVAGSGAYLIRKISGVNALFMWGLAALYYYFDIPPPLVGFAFAAFLFTIAFFATRRQSEN